MSRLPIVQDSIQERPRIRRSRSGKWRAGVLVAVHLLIAAHIAHWLVVGSSVTPVEPSEAMAFSKAGIVNAGLIFFAATILLTAVFGRFFCGWACHLVALQDLARWLLLKVGIRPRPLRSRVLAWVPAIAFAYMFLWPVAYRLWIGDSFNRYETHFTTQNLWATFPGWVIGGLTFLLCGFVIIYFLGAKGFCTYACPYGAIFGVAEKLSPLRIRVTDACQGCAHCTATCSSNVRVHQEVRDYGMVVDSGCMKCLDCVSVCPNDALYYGRGPIPLLAKPRVERPAVRKPAFRWWEEAVLAAAFAAAFFTFRGLYGLVPFLMSLGLAGILSFAVLLLVRLAVRPNVQTFHLKRRGRLLPAGYAFTAAMVLVLVFWAHSAYLRYHTFQGDRAFQEAASLRRAALDVAAAPRRPSPGEARRLEQAVEHLERVRDHGLFATAGNSGKLAWSYYLTGSKSRFRKEARQALARGEGSMGLHQIVARDALALGNLPRALAAYEQAIAAQPWAAEPYVGLGVTLARSGDLAAAEHVFARGLAAVEDSPGLLYNSGLIKALQGKPLQSIPLFERALELAPDHLEARENLAGVLASVGRYGESVGHYRRALEQAPDDAATRVLLARALLGAGRGSEAEAEIREALRLDPGQREAARLLTELQRIGGGSAKAGGGEPREDGASN